MFKKIWPWLATALIVISSIVSKAPALVAIATIIGVIFVLAVAYKKNIAPLLGAVLSVLYAVLSYQAGFFANAIMNLVVLTPLQLWGWWYWCKTKDQTFTLEKHWKLFITVATVIGAAISAYFAKEGGSDMWLLDGVSSVLVITGTVLLTFKTKEQWCAWIPYNFIECVMWFAAMSIEPSVMAIFVMRIVFLINSLLGAKEWNSK